MIRKTFRAKSFWLVKFCWCIIYYYWEDNLTRLVSKWQSTLFLLLTPAKRLPIHVLLRYTSKLNNLRKWRQQHSLYEFWRPMEYLGYIMVSLLRYVDRYLIRYSTSFLISRIIWIIKEIIMHPSWNVCVKIHFTKIWQYQNRAFVWTRKDFCSAPVVLSVFAWMLIINLTSLLNFMFWSESLRIKSDGLN